MSANPNRAREIFVAALKTAPEQWEAFLNDACGNDGVLRDRVQHLLAAHRQAAGSFLEPAAPALGTGAASPLPEGPGSRIGPYKLLQNLGEGGMGTVWVAEQTEPVKRRVALKVIKPGMDSAQVLRRFEAERQALALMDHTHIAKVFDAGTSPEGRPYFVMELVKGAPITKYCDELHLPIRERLELFVPVCQAIQHAHQKGIIHRDIKPSNVLVAIQDGKPLAKVIDFGVAKALHQRLTEESMYTELGQVIGTLEYMSPEQAELSVLDIDTRADVYALGAVLYELLTGSTPLDRKRLHSAAFAEMLQMIKEEEPPKPSTRLTQSESLPSLAAQRRIEPAKLTKAVRGELDWIVMKCLEKDRTRRYDTANSLARDVERYLHDEPVEACPPSAGYRLRKFARKYWIPVVVAAAFALLLVAGVVASTWQAVRATRAEGEAVQQRDLASTKRQEAEAAQGLARTAEEKAKVEAEQALREAYTAKIRLMQQAWESHDMVRLQDLLDQTADFPERRFEWYYWQRLCHVKNPALVGHTSGVTSVAFAPDGMRVATGGKDGTARVWDAGSGRELLCLRGHRCEVTAVAYAPGGQWLVTGSMDSTARIWDAADGRQLWTLQSPDMGSVRAIAVTPDGKDIITGSEDGLARVWDAASGQLLLVLDGHPALRVLAASTTGLLCAPQSPGPVLAASSLCPGRTGHLRAIWAVAVTPDGKRLATAGQDNMVMLWDAARGRQLRILYGHLRVDWGGVTSVAVTPDGKRLLTTGWDNSARIWDADTGKQLLHIQRIGWLEAATVIPDGKRLVIGQGSGAATVWETTALPDVGASTVGLLISPQAPRALLAAPALYSNTMRRREILSFVGHSAGIHCVAVSRDGRRLATASMDGTARVWDMTSDQGARIIKAHTRPVWSVAVTPDGQRIITGSMDSTAAVWDMASGRQLLQLEGHTACVSSVAATPDGRRIITGGGDIDADGKVSATARVWDAVTGRQLTKIEDKTVARVFTCIAVTPDGQQLLTGRYPLAQLWDLTSGREIRRFKGPEGIVESVAVTPDGRRVVMGCWRQGTPRVFDITNSQEIGKPKEPTGAVTSVAITPDGQRVVAGTECTAIVLDMVSGQEISSLRGHTDIVCSVAVSPDGQRIITGGYDGTARLWDASGGRELLTLDTHSGTVHSVAMSPDGRQLIAGCDDGTVRIWEAASPEEVTLWARQQKEFKRRRAAWQRPAAGTPGFITDWLILAPIPLNAGETGPGGLQREQLRPEATLQPRAGERVPVDSKDFTWREDHEEEPVLDFSRLFAKPFDHRVAYLVCYVISPTERHDLILQVGSDDMAKVYLNGEQVYYYPGVRPINALDSISVTLHKGTNVLVFKVVNETENWGACARFVDQDYNPVQGLKIRLTPE